MLGEKKVGISHQNSPKSVSGRIYTSIIQNLSQHTYKWHAISSMWCTWLIHHSCKTLATKTKKSPKLKENWKTACKVGTRMHFISSPDLIKTRMVCSFSEDSAKCITQTEASCCTATEVICYRVPALQLSHLLHSPARQLSHLLHSPVRKLKSSATESLHGNLSHLHGNWSNLLHDPCTATEVICYRVPAWQLKSSVRQLKSSATGSLHDNLSHLYGN